MITTNLLKTYLIDALLAFSGSTSTTWGGKRMEYFFLLYITAILKYVYISITLVFFILFRCGKQRLREARIQGVDYLILGLAGICLGTLAKVSDETFGALGYTYTVIAVCKFLSPSWKGVFFIHELFSEK